MIGEFDPEMGSVQKVELGGLHRCAVFVDALERERLYQGGEGEHFFVCDIGRRAGGDG